MTNGKSGRAGIVPYCRRRWFDAAEKAARRTVECPFDDKLI
jgi:hypothetical protein